MPEAASRTQSGYGDAVSTMGQVTSACEGSGFTPEDWAALKDNQIIRADVLDRIRNWALDPIAQALAGLPLNVSLYTSREVPPIISTSRRRNVYDLKPSAFTSRSYVTDICQIDIHCERKLQRIIYAKRTTTDRYVGIVVEDRPGYHRVLEDFTEMTLSQFTTFVYDQCREARKGLRA